MPSQPHAPIGALKCQARVVVLGTCGNTLTILWINPRGFRNRLEGFQTPRQSRFAIKTRVPRDFFPNGDAAEP